MDLQEIFSLVTSDGTPDYSEIINELKSKRFSELPDTGKYQKQLDPLKHDVYDQRIRPNKLVKMDPDDPLNALSGNVTNVMAGSTGTAAPVRIEPVARVALAIQKLIVNRAVSFIFGNPVEYSASPENERQKAVYHALDRVMYDIKERSFNRKIARTLFSCTEVAEYWYPVEKPNNTYGFPSQYKLRCSIFSPLNGDALYPYFDETGDMIAFSREFALKSSDGKDVKYFETYTDQEHILWEQGASGYEVVEGYPRNNEIGKIPVIYGAQKQVEWADVQNLIDRLEKLLSNFADTNDYHASPKIVVKGELLGFAKKGESGAILQLEGDDARAEYLSWANAPESVKLEITTLLNMIYTITQTPDISFESVKGIGAISGIALKLLFMDAHLKVADHQEVFDEYLQRRVNVVKAFIGKFNTGLGKDADNLMIEPDITPYIVKDEAAELKIWMDANGGNAVMSQKASFLRAGMTTDPEQDYVQYESEQSSKSMFTLGEPTDVE